MSSPGQQTPDSITYYDNLSDQDIMDQNQDAMDQKPLISSPGPATVLETILPVSCVPGLALQSVRSHDDGGCGGHKTATALLFNQGDCNSLVYQAALTIASLGQRVLVVLGGGSWSGLPPTTHSMPPADPSNMQKISFLYPHNLEELIQYTAAVPSTDNLPQSVIVGNIENLIQNSILEGSDTASTGPSRQVCLMAKMSAVLTDFLDVCSSKNSGSVHPSRLLVTAQFDNWTKKQVEERAHLWYQEVWELNRSNSELVEWAENSFQLFCKSSNDPISVQYYTSKQQIFLHSVSGKYL